MKQYENLYAGLNGRRFIGGVDLDQVRKKRGDLEIYDGETKVGFLNKDILFQAFKERKNGEKA